MEPPLLGGSVPCPCLFGGSVVLVRMKVKVSGSRNGVEWPDVGGEVDLPEIEAEALVSAGMAEVVPSPKRSGKVAAVKTPVGEKRRRKNV